MRFVVFPATLALLLTPVVAAGAHSVAAGGIALSGLWTRATPPRAVTAGGYLTITNTGSEPDRLIAVSSPLADSGELHEMAVSDGVMTMRPLDGGIPIPAGGAVVLAPGGFHLMFIGLEDRLVEGAEFPVTLVFEKAGTVETFLHVEAIGARGPSTDGHAQGHGQ